MPSYKKKIKAVEAWKVAREIVVALGVQSVVCGSLRRGLEEVNDIDIVVDEQYASDTVQQLIERLPDIKVITDLSKPKVHVDLLVKDIQINMIGSLPEYYGAAFLYLTGSKYFNLALRWVAKNQGFKLNEYGLWCGGERIAGEAESHVFSVLGLEYMPPADRNFGFGQYIKGGGKA